MSTPSSNRADGLLPLEGVAMDGLVQAANAFAQLPVQHPDDLLDFVRAIHQGQDILALRVARRAFPDGWSDLSQPQPQPQP